MRDRSILIVDDERVVTKLVSHVARTLGFARIEVAYDAQDALQRLSTTEFDLVLSDIKMEGRSGLHLVSDIRGKASSATVPVILMTAARDPGLALAAKRVGANAFLAKPFSPDALRQAIDRAAT